MRALITGSGGQVGQKLVRLCPPDIETLALSRADCDITNAAAVSDAVRKFRPDVIINAAAFTDVDGAETNPDAAFSGNRDGVANLAVAASRQQARLVHISTDYVFDGRNSTPYGVDAQPSPRSIYGSSKLAGEHEIAKSGVRATIVRTGWVYSEFSRNFLLTMLGLLRRGRSPSVVTDQIGTPTSAHDLANFLWQVVQQPPDAPLFHWSNAGVGSWYDFAVAICELAGDRGLIDRSVRINPVTTEEFYASLPESSPPRKHAERPAFSVLDCSDAWKLFGVPRQWRAALAETLDRIA